VTSSSRAKFFMLVVHISGVVVGIAAGLWLFDQWT